MNVERTGVYILEACVAVESHESGECDGCGRSGIRSSWSGDDPENSGALYLVLCPDDHGQLLCDLCAQ